MKKELRCCGVCIVQKFGKGISKMKKIAFLSHLDLNLYLFRLPIMIALVKKGYKVYAICPMGEKFDQFEQYGIEALEYKIQRKSLIP